MPIALHAPAQAAHATGAVPARRDVDDVAAASDAFTLLLLAASTVDDAQATDDPAIVAATESAGTSTDANPDATAPTCLIDPAIEAARIAALAAGMPAPTGVVDGPARAIALAKGDAAVRPGTGTGRVDSPARGAPSGIATPAPQGPTPQVDIAAWRAARPAPETPAKPAAVDAAAASDARAELANPRTAATPEPKADLALHLPALDAPLEAKHGNTRSQASELTPSMAPLASATGRIADERPPLPLEIITPAFTAGWQDEAVGRLAQVVLTRNERAELKLHPAELGPVSIRVELQADQASLTIVAASAETRSALEQSLPQLRDLLAGQGITLGQTSVHDGQAQRDDARPAFGTRALRDPVEAAPAPVVTSTWTVRPSNGRVDVFA
jgi:flagellar hook-length control protein FliK